MDWGTTIASSILPPRVQIPSTSSKLLLIYIWIAALGKDENKQKEAGIGSFLKKNTRCIKVLANSFGTN